MPITNPTHTYQARLHIKETYVDSIYGRIFEGWMSGDALNVFGSLAHTHCAMPSGQAIAYKVAVEKCAFEYSQAVKVDADWQPIESVVNVEVIFDFIN